MRSVDLYLREFREETPKMINDNTISVKYFLQRVIYGEKLIKAVEESSLDSREKGALIERISLVIESYQGLLIPACAIELGRDSNGS